MSMPNEKRCRICGKPRHNDTYGERCEDCYIDCVSPSASNKRADWLRAHAPTNLPTKGRGKKDEA